MAEQAAKLATAESKVAKQGSQVEQDAKGAVRVCPVPASRRQDSQGANAMVTFLTDVTLWTLC